MQTVLEVLKKSEDFLEKKGVPRAKLDAQWLIADALELKRLELFLHHDRPLEESQLVVLRERVRRRAQREPLQYILGNTPFCDLDIICDKRALIARPETEEFADRIIRLLTDHPPTRVLDLGTGSGVLALALAQAFPKAEVCAVDISEDALALAGANAKRNDLERVRFLKSAWFEGVQGPFDLIVSNPPYLTEQEWVVAEPEVRDYEPKGALVSDLEGRADLESILREAPDYLNEGGLLALETGIAQRDALTQCAQACTVYKRVWGEDDFSGHQRYFYAAR